MGTTANQKRLFFNLRKMKSRIQALDEGDLRPDQVAEIATKLGVTTDEVVSMNGRLSGPDASLNAPLRGTEGEGQWQDWLSDDQAESQEEELAQSDEFDTRMQLLQSAMGELNEREQHILQERRLSEDPKTLEELADHYGVSRERIRQIEVRAFEKLQKAMKSLAKDSGLMH